MKKGPNAGKRQPHIYNTATADVQDALPVTNGLTDLIKPTLAETINALKGPVTVKVSSVTQLSRL